MKKTHQTILLSALGGAAVTAGGFLLLVGLFLWSWSHHLFTLGERSPSLIGVIGGPLLFMGVGALIFKGILQRSTE